MSDGGPLLLNLEFLHIARKKLADVFGPLATHWPRLEHLSETLCFLPIAKLV